MVASPNIDPNWIKSELERLQTAINKLTGKNLQSANIGSGGITIDGTGGITVNPAAGGLGQFYVGGGSNVHPHADGTPQIITSIGDELGRDRLTLYDENNPAVEGNQRWHEWDVNGNLVRSQDINGGWATPWFNVPLYPRFTPPQNSPDTSGSLYGYATVSTSTPGIVQGQQLWEGRIPFGSHPQIAIDGTWGPASGSVVPTYSLNVGGSSVGTWSPAFGPAAFGPWNIASLLGHTQIPVNITVTWTGTGLIAADVVGCYLRQS